MEILSVQKPQPFLYANFGWEQRKTSGLSTYHIKHFGRINTTELSHSNNDYDSVRWEYFEHVARQSFYGIFRYTTRLHDYRVTMHK